MHFLLGALLLVIAPIQSSAAFANAAKDTALPTSEKVMLELGERFVMTSEILGEDREILVKLPASYGEGDKRYPVVILLDGNNHFAHASVGASLLSENEVMPEAILVALPNVAGQRGRDLAGAKENFRKFISDEVFTLIDQNFRTSSHRTLFGHSLAGYFALSVFADHGEMFDSYIVASPVIQVRDSELIGKFELLLKGGIQGNKRLYLTITDADAEVQGANPAFDKFVDLLEAQPSDKLKWRSEFIKGQVHMTTPFLTLYAGLAFAFNQAQ